MNLQGPYKTISEDVKCVIFTYHTDKIYLLNNLAFLIVREAQKKTRK